MNMNKWLALLGLVILVGCSSTSVDPRLGYALPDGVTLVEQSLPPQTGQPSIPFNKFLLDNGLTVILSPDHSDPLVHVDVTYHVGSAREQIGRSGFAHFFEHMMFQGSEHVGDQQHFKIVTEAGGTLNGTTNRDRTNYYQTVPSNQLEKMLWLESDRMGYLVNAVSQRKFEIQRDTVKNERAQNYDNRPYGLMYEKIGEALYPQNHPYSWQTIGYVSDLDRVDVNDLKAFFLRWYGPNNAVLTIGGDIDEAQTLAWIKQYFGAIPRGPEVDNAPKQPVALEQTRFITLQDQIRQPLVMLAFPTTYLGEKSQASINTLASILGSGKNSVLYQKLVKTELAIDAGAFHNCGELSCTLYVYAMGDAGKKGDLTPLYQHLTTALAEFSQQGAQQSQLDEILGRAEAGTVYAVQSVSGKVSQLASNQTFYQQPDRLQIELQQLRQVTPPSVMEAYQTYVADKPRVVLSVVPKGQLTLQVEPANFTPPVRELPNYPKITDEQLSLRQPVEDFDRNQMPPVASAVQATIPPLYRFQLDNGIEVLGTVSDETPTVQILVTIPAGNRYVPVGKEGLAELTAQLMQEGTQSTSSEQLQQQLDKLGSSVSFSVGNYSTTLSIASLTSHLDETLAIANEMLFKPAFKQQDFERLQNQAVQGVIYSHQKPAWLASQATKQVLFNGSVFGRDNDGSMQSLQGLTLRDVELYYQQHYTPQGSSIVVVGDISQQSAQQSLAFLQDWQGPESRMIEAGKMTSPRQQSLYLVDKPNAPQTIVRLVRVGLPYDATGETYLAQLANYNLAGNFNSRINQNLREDKGFTYGAGGYISGGKETGLVVFEAQVRADATVASIEEFVREMHTYSQQGMTDAELSFMRLAVGQQDALKYETPSQKAGLLSTIAFYDLDDDFMQHKANILAQVDKELLNKVAQIWFQPQDYQIIVVGDAKTLLPQLKKLSIPVETLEVKP